MRPAGTIRDCPARDDGAFLPDPHLGFAFAHGEHLLDRMRMRRGAGADGDPLLENA